jgi:hypothetical protein
MGAPRALDAETIVSNNFAFGGVNTSLVFRRWREEEVLEPASEACGHPADRGVRRPRDRSVRVRRALGDERPAHGLEHRASDQEEARAVAGDVDPALEAKDVPLPAYISNGVIHPYLGFVLRPDFKPLKRAQQVARTRSSTDSACSSRGCSTKPPPIRSWWRSRVARLRTTLAMRAGDQLRGELQRLRPGARFVIVNLALPGYKQPQQLMSLAWVLSLGAHFDAVINVDGFNEVALAPLENVPKRVFPFYPARVVAPGLGVRTPTSSSPPARSARCGIRARNEPLRSSRRRGVIR